MNEQPSAKAVEIACKHVCGDMCLGATPDTACTQGRDLAAAIDSHAAAVTADLRAQLDAYIRFHEGEPVQASTNAIGEATYGYGERDADGYWEFPVPTRVVEQAADLQAELDGLREMVGAAFGFQTKEGNVIRPYSYVEICDMWIVISLDEACDMLLFHDGIYREFTDQNVNSARDDWYYPSAAAAWAAYRKWREASRDNHKQKGE